MGPDSVEANDGIKAVKVDSKMPTREILLKFMRPHEAHPPSQIVGCNKVLMAGIEERLTTNPSTMDEMIQQVNVILVKLCSSRKSCVHHSPHRLFQEYTAFHQSELRPEERCDRDAGGKAWFGHTGLTAEHPSSDTADMNATTSNETPIGGCLKRLVRPSTRGELARRLKSGESCEVAGYVAEMTSIMLRGWLGVENFTVTESANPGWVIYRPNDAAQAGRAGSIQHGTEAESRPCLQQPGSPFVSSGEIWPNPRHHLKGLLHLVLRAGGKLVSVLSV